MKRFSKVLLMVVVVGFVFGMTLSLSAENQPASKKECCKEMKCAVCKSEVDKEKAQFKSEYKGGIYYFAKEKCKAEFDKNPEKYVNACHYKVVYTCPMKQDNVTQDKPGKCPKCGMDLKKVEEKVCNCTGDKTGCAHGESKKECAGATTGCAGHNKK